MTRKKPKSIVTVRDKAAANEALAQIADIKRKVADIENQMNDIIDKAKASGAAQAAPLKKRMAALEAGLIAFAEFNKSQLFHVRRSVELDYGRIGYRRTRELKTKSKITWAMVLERLKELSFIQAIRTKESIDKDELHKWPDERLELIGVRRVKRDQFWYETDEERIADTVTP